MKRSTESIALVAVILAACGRGPVTVEAPMIAADAEPPAVAAGDAGRPSVASAKASDVPFERGDRYRGHYWCAQGRTELTLVIEDIGDDDEIEAIFEFDFPGSPAYSPAVGSYRMRGTWDARSKTLRLKAHSWIDQPAGYMMVDLSGTVMGSGAISGRVTGTGASCTTFTVSPERAKGP